MIRYVPRLDEAHADEAARQNFELWGGGRTPDEHLAFVRAQLAHAGPEILRYVGLFDGDELVASIKRYGLTLAQRGETVRAVGIGAVFTRPDRRKSGFAARLLERVLGEAADLGYGAAFLYSEIDARYYEELGFVPLAADEHEALARDLPREHPLAVRPAGAEDLDLLLAHHEASFAPLPYDLRPRRSRAIHRFFAWRNHVRGAFLLLDGDAVVGSLLATRDDPLRDLPELVGDSLWVDEWCAPGVPRDRVLATLRMLAEHTGVSRVRAWLPGADVAPFVARPRRDALPMIAPLNGLAFDPARAFLDAFGHF